MQETELMKIIAKSALPDIKDVRDDCVRYISEEKKTIRKYVYVNTFLLIFISSLAILLIKNGYKDFINSNNASPKENITDIGFELPPYTDTDSLHFEKNQILTIGTQKDKVYEHVIIYKVGEGTLDKVEKLSYDNKYIYNVSKDGDYIIYCEKDGELYNISKELSIDISINNNDENNESGIIPLN